MLPRDHTHAPRLKGRCSCDTYACHLCLTRPCVLLVSRMSDDALLKGLEARQRGNWAATGPPTRSRAGHCLPLAQIEAAVAGSAAVRPPPMRARAMVLTFCALVWRVISTAALRGARGVRPGLQPSGQSTTVTQHTTARPDGSSLHRLHARHAALPAAVAWGCSCARTRWRQPGNRSSAAVELLPAVYPRHHRVRHLAKVRVPRPQRRAHLHAQRTRPWGGTARVLRSREHAADAAQCAHGRQLQVRASMPRPSPVPWLARTRARAPWLQCPGTGRLCC